jgi:phenylacetate-CoA ligase
MIRPIRTWALRRIVVPAADLYFGQRLMARLDLLERAQWWTRARLDSNRLEQLVALVTTAYSEVPFYNDLMRNAGVAPEDIRSLEDLRRLPIVTKPRLREGYPDRTVRRTAQRAYEVQSSGTTGEETLVLEDSETSGVYRASFLLSLQWAGWRFGERHMQTGVNLRRSSDRTLKDFFLGCSYVSALDLTEDTMDAVLDRMDRKRIRHLWGYPRSIYFLARRARGRGWDQPLRSVVTWGDNLYEHYRRTIEGAFRTRVFDTYGCGEGFQVAAQCGVDQTYHVHDLDVILELLDGEGRPVGPGRAGNVVVTRLHPGPMPLIRYQVGDVAVRGPLEACSCGRQFERLVGIEGRDTEIVVTPSGGRLSAQVFAELLDVFPEMATLQVVQTDTSAIVVRVVPAEPRGSIDWETRIQSALKQRGAHDLRIAVEIVDDIPRTPSGKRRLVINNVMAGVTIGSAVRAGFVA